MEQREYSKYAYAKRRINIHPQKVQLPPRTVNTIDCPTVLRTWGPDSPKSIEIK